MKVSKNNIDFNVEDNTPGNPGFWTLVETDEWESFTFKIFSKFLDKEHSFLDIGAWIGPTVLYGSKLALHCFAIEPDPIAYAILKQNISLNNFLNIDVWQGAINNVNGIVTMGNNDLQGNSMSSILLPEKNSWEVECQTLENFMLSRNIKNCNFIKIDIEGGEALVIPEATNILKNFPHTLYLSIHAHLLKNSKDLENITKVLKKIYKYFYLAKTGARINTDFIKNQKKSFSIVATNKWLKTTW